MSTQYPVLPLRNSILFPESILTVAVGREQSLTLVDEAVAKGGEEALIVLVAQRDSDISEPVPEDLYEVGTVAKILQVLQLSPEKLTLVVQGVRRVRLTKITQTEPYFVGEFEDLEDVNKDPKGLASKFTQLKDLAIDLSKNSPDVPKETPQVLSEIKTASGFCDFLSGNLQIDVKDRQKILEMLDVDARVKFVTDVLKAKELASQVSAKLQDSVKADVDKTQKEYFLRQQLKAIKRELGEEDDLDELEDRIDNADMPQEAHKAAIKQFNRMRIMQPSSSEYSVTLTYIETLLDLPWKKSSRDNLKLDNAKKILDADHYGLEKVKKRILEYLAVRSLKKDMKGPILCLVGPPGVGKTSCAKSIANALGRKFVRISLGGVSEESEIRGHRRTYVGAMPGRLAKALITAGTNNPVILLDEIDKIGKDFKGDPESALLEVLDPAQNNTFSDHYVEVPLDLSKVLFITTANQLDSISSPLRDRMEIIEVPSYTSFEKQKIAMQHFVPKQIKEHGITPKNLNITDEVVAKLIDSYTREAGVRNLERRVAELCRSVAVQVATAKPKDRKKIHVDITPEYITEALGPERYFSDVAQRVAVPGVSTGLAWTQAGGDILFIEASTMKGKGEVKLTGQLGDVMKESAITAVSYLKSNPYQYGLEPGFLDELDLHIHFPAGSIPKDGPSAGITILCAILSMLTGVCVKPDVAMTGEITLRGTVLPVGGIKEKLTAAHRAGIKRIIIPSRCAKDLVDISDEIRNDLSIHLVDRAEELIGLVFDGPLPIIPLPTLEEGLDEVSVVN